MWNIDTEAQRTADVIAYCGARVCKIRALSVSYNNLKQNMAIFIAETVRQFICLERMGFTPTWNSVAKSEITDQERIQWTAPTQNWNEMYGDLQRST